MQDRIRERRKMDQPGASPDVLAAGGSIPETSSLDKIIMS
jgi:hypothetical protein